MNEANRTAFLDAIAACEGTNTPDGYRALFGYTSKNQRLFDNGYITHPNIRFPFTQTDGVQNYSTAAGRYQIIYPTFRDYASKLVAKFGSASFTPEVQDWIALDMIDKAGALDDVDAGRFQAAVDKCAGIWASLPASHYPQPKRTLSFALEAYTGAGGVVA
jgi:muramidase (phage lysozyme)